MPCFANVKVLKTSLRTYLKLGFPSMQTLPSCSYSSTWKPHLPGATHEPQPPPSPSPPVSVDIFTSGTNRGSRKWGSYSPGDLTFYSLIENYASSFDFVSLEKVLDQMKREKRVFIEKNFIVMFKAYGKAHLPEKAVDLFRRMEVEFQCKKTVKSLNSVLNVIIQDGLFNRALEFYSDVDASTSLNIQPNVLTFNLIIKALCKLGLVDKAIEAFREMPPRGCAPDTYTYSTLMDGLCKEGRIDEAILLLDEMQIEERGHRGNEHIYSSLISGLFKEGKSEEAMRLWKEMVEKGCQPNTIVYSALIDGLCRVGKPDEARKLLVEMKNKGYLPNSFTYSSLMKGFFNIGDSHNAILVWKEMTASNSNHNEVSYSILINGLCKDGKLMEALMAWKQMLSRGIKLDVIAYSSMIHGFCNAQLVEQGLKLFHQMLCQPETQPDVVTYNILFHALCMQNSISRAIDVLNIMLDQGCDPDYITCDIFLRALRERVNPPQDGAEFLDELVVRLIKRQKVVGASKTIEVMLQKFLLPKGSTWATVVKHLCKPKKVRETIRECWSKLCH
ncbi:pentatricopeptide repeat-containing protein At4g20090 isoform X2 [Arachis ipaensis]|uniref:pentatricopeptide repeat-containing protein At4g20090 isoform X2 n=1 Tax=Arachis ipaensis TaxID=130454 RepID=UPI000A2B1DC9|nr:pentatricopeptide repeat-containing protein At4g20090 isoform X2 [Arachis ipaensis]XP_029150865.1 pentatricopeptide repeat-containing protein At4g20090 isoform X2 [Arachis hypogaea]